MERIMPAEQLNIKINLDINELNANVKKAKTKIITNIKILINTLDGFTSELANKSAS